MNHLSKSVLFVASCLLLTFLLSAAIVEKEGETPHRIQKDFSEFKALFDADVKIRAQAWVDGAGAAGAWETWYKPTAIITEVYYDGEKKNYILGPIGEVIKLFEGINITAYQLDTRVIKRIEQKGKGLVHVAGYARYTADLGLGYPVYLHETFSATGTFNLSGTPGAGVVQPNGEKIAGKPVFQAVMEDIFIEQTKEEESPFAIVDMNQ